MLQLVLHTFCHYVRTFFLHWFRISIPDNITILITYTLTLQFVSSPTFTCFTVNTNVWFRHRVRICSFIARFGAFWFVSFKLVLIFICVIIRIFQTFVWLTIAVSTIFSSLPTSDVTCSAGANYTVVTMIAVLSVFTFTPSASASRFSLFVLTAVVWFFSTKKT